VVVVEADVDSFVCRARGAVARFGAMTPDERCARLTAAFERPMLVAALLVVPTVAIENAGLSGGWVAVAKILNWVIWTAFASELVVLLAVAPNRRRWLAKHPLDVAIVVLTPPLAPAGLQALRAFRLLRLLRLIRLAKLSRSVFSLDGVAWAALVAFLLVEACGIALVTVEGTKHHPHLTLPDGLWWAISTVTTVGYGDIAPVTIAGRLIAMCIMVIGLGFVAILTAGIAQHFVARGAASHADAETAQQILAAVQDVQGQIHSVAERLDRLEAHVGTPVLADPLRSGERPRLRSRRGPPTQRS
jgi:voltage-gated potassium channel